MVSIIMPIYNAYPYVKYSLFSVLNQTYSDLEILVIDDGSTDGSFEYLNEIIDNRLYVYKNDKKGACSARNLGLKKAKGDFIQLTDSVSFKYEGKLLSGEIFDKQTKPITFNVKDLIAGWKEIMLKLKPGAKVFLIVPPHLGYGTHDLDDIPESSSLVFNMEIIDVQ